MCFFRIICGATPRVVLLAPSFSNSNSMIAFVGTLETLQKAHYLIKLQYVLIAYTKKN